MTNTPATTPEFPESSQTLLNKMNKFIDSHPFGFYRHYINEPGEPNPVKTVQSIDQIPDRIEPLRSALVRSAGAKILGELVLPGSMLPNGRHTSRNYKLFAGGDVTHELLRYPTTTSTYRTAERVLEALREDEPSNYGSGLIRHVSFTLSNELNKNAPEVHESQRVLTPEEVVKLNAELAALNKLPKPDDF